MYVLSDHARRGNQLWQLVNSVKTETIPPAGFSKLLNSVEKLGKQK